MKLRTFSTMLCLLLMATLLAACGGDGEDETDGSDEAATTTVATPVADSDASPTRAIPSPIASPTIEPTIEPTQTYTAEQTALLDVILSPSELPDGWQQLRAGVPEENDDPGLCGAPQFPRADERIAEVEAEYQSGDNSSFILQNLTQFPEDAAIEAMQYVRDSVTCEEFTDESGTTFTLSPAEAPSLGDDAFMVNVAFQVADAGEFTGQFVYIRTDGLISIVSYLTLGALDLAQVEQIATAATDKMTAVTDDGRTIENVADVLGSLLTVDDFPDGWQPIAPAGISDPAGWSPLCGAEPFSGINESIARVSANFYDSTAEDSAAVQQVIEQFPPELVEPAMAYERESASCQQWDADGMAISLQPAQLPTLGDESLAVTYTYDDPNRGEIQGIWIVVRIGNLISHIVYTDPEAVDTAFIEQVTRRAVSRMEEGAVQ